MFVLFVFLLLFLFFFFFFFSSRRRHTRYIGDWSSDVCSSDLHRPHAVYRDERAGDLQRRCGGAAQRQYRRRGAQRRRQRRHRPERRAVRAHRHRRQELDAGAARDPDPGRHGEGAAGKELVPQILRLRGPRAVSEFRLAKLLASLQKLDPGVGSVAAGFWPFVEVAGARGAREAEVLERLLEYGPAPQPADGTLFLVVPRLGTVSPWSSKATDIARNCGLARVRRIERGTAYYGDSRRPG